MAWIELHDTLPDHDKVLEVADALHMDKDMVVGKLVRLWTWAINHREDGLFKARDVSTIAEVMRFRGRPQKLVDALIEARLLDVHTDGCIAIHDWDERVEMLLEKRERKRAQTRARVRRYREGRQEADADTPDLPDESDDCNALHMRYNAEEYPACNAATVPNRTVPIRDIYNVSSSTSTRACEDDNISAIPSYADVQAYADAIGKQMDCHRFLNYYKARGWKVGGAPICDWRALLRNWQQLEGIEELSSDDDAHTREEYAQYEREILMPYLTGGKP